jgi:anti-sigma regulatory factor (Ser/Thr protein kinase)
VVVTDDASFGPRLALEAGVDGLAEVRAFVRERAARLGASSRSVDDLVQAVDEASCNIILHGYGGKPGPIELEIERRGDAIAVTLSDRATPFDPTERPLPDGVPEVQPTVRGHAGMGVRLLRTMMDEVHHAARPDGGNELTLVRSIEPGEED